jgi:RimJ/RimL family protein N-acetyltransferase
MNFIGSKTIETDRLILKAQTMDEQKKLWEILMIPSVNSVYLTTPPKFREKLKDWSKQEPFYINKIEHALDGDVFEWSIFLKESNDCIGKIDYHEYSTEDESIEDKSIRGVGWYIDPIHQGKGYATEAATATLKYMFEEVEITKIITGAAIDNPASWKIMNKLGYKKLPTNSFVNYTFKDEPVEVYTYEITKNDYQKNSMI